MRKLIVVCFLTIYLFLSLDKLLGAITTAAERHNRERFSQIVEGLENHEFLQLQVGLLFYKLINTSEII